MSYMYIFTYTSFCMCIFICANICMDSPMGNSLAPVSISLDKYGGRKCPYQSYHRNLEAWSFFLPFQKVTNKKLTEIPSSIQKNHHPAAKFEAVFVFLVPFFFHQPWLGISREPHSIFKTFLGSNSSALRRCATDGMGRYFYNLLTNKWLEMRRLKSILLKLKKKKQKQIKLLRKILARSSTNL